MLTQRKSDKSKNTMKPKPAATDFTDKIDEKIQSSGSFFSCCRYFYFHFMDDQRRVNGRPEIELTILPDSDIEIFDKRLCLDKMSR